MRPSFAPSKPTVLLCANPEYWPPVAFAMRSTGFGGRSLLAGDFYMSPTVPLCAHPEEWPPVALAMRSTGLRVGARLRAIFTFHRLTTS